MNNIWSDNRYINLLVNFLLFMVGVNFLHYGQLLLPIICLILFVDNKLQFKVNKPLVFITLCLFAISFYGFSYNLGFYSVMGFTLPMAYYIGSNIKDNNEDKIKKVIYLLAFSMCIHLILNSIYEYIVHGPDGFFFSSSHYDIWTRGKVSSTLIAIDIVLLIGCLYYLIFHENNKTVKISGIVLFVLGMAYLLIIGRRTPILILILTMLVSFIYESFVAKTITEKNKRIFIKVSIAVVISIVLMLLAYNLNIMDIQNKLSDFRLIQKLKQGLMNDERISVLINTIRLMPKYLFGGQKISTELALQVHHFWLDIYDYAGIVPFVIICIYSVYYLMTYLKVLNNNQVSNRFKTLITGLFVCIFILLNIEPMMTGASIFVIISVIIEGLLEGLSNE